jgi:hypothetical protein
MFAIMVNQRAVRQQVFQEATTHAPALPPNSTQLFVKATFTACYAVKVASRNVKHR